MYDFCNILLCLFPARVLYLLFLFNLPPPLSYPLPPLVNLFLKQASIGNPLT